MIEAKSFDQKRFCSREARGKAERQSRMSEPGRVALISALSLWLSGMILLALDVDRLYAWMIATLICFAAVAIDQMRRRRR
jgi:hypothetical protein